MGGDSLRLSDASSEATYERDGYGMEGPGLYVELGPWNCSFFRCSRSRKAMQLVPAA